MYTLPEKGEHRLFFLWGEAIGKGEQCSVMDFSKRLIANGFTIYQDPSTLLWMAKK